MIYIRNIKNSDNFEQYMKCVQDLNGSSVEICSIEQMRRGLSTRSNNINTYVLLLDDKIVATATVIFEKKIRYNQLCCHIEDVGVDPEYRKRGYGKMMVEHCIGVAKSKNCYKVKLNCSDKNVNFYDKMGFVVSSNGMEQKV